MGINATEEKGIGIKKKQKTRSLENNFICWYICQNIIIISFEKGDGVVIMDRE